MSFLKHFIYRFVVVPTVLVGVFLSLSNATHFKIAQAAGVPTIFSYQGRLTDSSGSLLGGSSGTTYYFKFSIWDNSSVGSGSRVWPLSAPSFYGTSVKQGLFNVNIGDTGNGYPDTLDYNFSNPNVFLQVEVATTSGGTYQTLTPRQQISSIAFSQVSGAVSGTGQSSVGTTSPGSNSVLTVEATTTTATPLLIRGVSGQIANLFDVKNNIGSSLFAINNTGGILTTSSSTLQALQLLNLRLQMLQLPIFLALQQHSPIYSLTPQT